MQTFDLLCWCSACIEVNSYKAKENQFFYTQRFITIFMTEETKKTCFVIMPITTPKMYEERYRDDDHFIHVGEYLFKPAIEKAGFTPILPISKGSENIQADIIKKLETSDLVLCDMSILNPNVFFEFGIRTALDKPICLVKDEFLTKEQMPFDPYTINYHEYSSNLAPWIVTTGIDELSAHIKDSYGSNEGHNPLWKYFGFNMIARPEEGVATSDDKLDYINRRIDTLITQLNKQEQTGRMKESFHRLISKTSAQENSYEKANTLANTINQIEELFVKYGHKEILNKSIAFMPNGVQIFIKIDKDFIIPAEIQEYMSYISTTYGFEIKLILDSDI